MRSQMGSVSIESFEPEEPQDRLTLGVVSSAMGSIQGMDVLYSLAKL